MTYSMEYNRQISEPSPIYGQWLRIKDRYPDAIILMRIGDFYEAFGGDAKTVAEVCDLVLTSRILGTDRDGKKSRRPMAGMMVHASEAYIQELVAAGHKVAIVEQTATHAVQGLMPREVRRVVGG